MKHATLSRADLGARHGGYVDEGTILAPMKVIDAVVKARRALIAPHGSLFATFICDTAVNDLCQCATLREQPPAPGTRCGKVQFMSWSSSYLRVTSRDARERLRQTTNTAHHSMV